MNFSITEADRKQRQQERIEETTRYLYAVYARKFLMRLGRKLDKIHAIVGIREPVGLVLASLFENHRFYFSSLDEMTPQACHDLISLQPEFHPNRLQFMADV